jgi:hypothetical protein
MEENFMFSLVVLNYSNKNKNRGQHLKYSKMIGEKWKIKYFLIK